MRKNSKKELFLLLLLLLIFVITPVALSLGAVEDGQDIADSVDMEDAEEGEEEEVSTAGVIKGNIAAPDHIEKDKIIVYLYDNDTYTEDEEENEVRPETDAEEEWDNLILLETAVQEDGSIIFENVEAGNYRIEFASAQIDLDYSRYEVVNLPPEVGWEVGNAWEKARLGFVVLTVGEQEEAEFYLNIVEKQDEEESDVNDEVEEEPVEEEQDAAGEEETAEEIPESDEGETDISDEEEAGSDSSQSEEQKEELTGDTDESDLSIGDDTEEDSLLTFAELEELDKDEVGATMAEIGFFSKISHLVSGSTWNFNAVYVGEEDPYHVDRTRDFLLKYQMMFDTSSDLEVGELEVRIPAVLLTYRDGTKIYPTMNSIAPGTPEMPVETELPLNYYLDPATDELVFFNYAFIEAGQKLVFEVLYKGLKTMEIVDETTWKLTPKITVAGERRESRALTGTVDTAVKLNTVTKIPYSYTGTAYTPGLYTKSQVNKYIDGVLPQEYEDNFDDYVYVVWEVAVRGTASQPWNLFYKDTSSHGGEVVGWSAKPDQMVTNYKLNENKIASGAYAGYIEGIDFKKDDKIDQTHRVVTAYPKGTVSEGDILTNTLDVVLQPGDKIDPVQTKSAQAEWGYKNYVWRYPPGYIIGLTKKAYPYNQESDSSVFKGWLDVYKSAAAAGEDNGDFNYRTNSSIRGYEYTHHITGADIGKYIPGTSYKSITVDDVLYAHHDKNTTPVMMTDKDYYFSKVKVTQRDIGYDVWEDKTAEPDPAGDVVVYAMFAGSTSWIEVDKVQWSPGTMTYTFSPEDLAKQPWRVKAEHVTTNYKTECSIDVDVRIRHNSPLFSSMLQQNPASITVQNLSGVYGECYKDNSITPYDYILGTNDEDDTVNYSKYPTDLSTTTSGLYGRIIKRDSAAADLYWLIPDAGAYKTAKVVSSDATNRRVNVGYTVTAYDGYQIYSQEAAGRLASEGLASPGIKEVVFYDLLPLGVKFDPAVPVIAGRTTTIGTERNNTYRSTPSLWDTSQVRVTIDSAADVTENYDGTGRTMVRFHIFYEGADPAFYGNDMWLEAWGVSFGAYYEWKDLSIVNKLPNISAFMPAEDIDLHGSEGQVWQDDGSVPDDIYREFGIDIDRDGNTTEKNVLYASSEPGIDDIALSSSTEIVKTVKADADVFGVFGPSAAVEHEKGYTYEITQRNAIGTVKDIVIFDRLENAVKDRWDEEPGAFENTSWHGTFKGLQLRGLTIRGIVPVVYYNADREARIPDINTPENPASILIPANGWIKAQDWTLPLSDVKAFAVDCSKVTGGGDFELQPTQEISFQVYMTAPGTDTVPTYAYNNPSYYSKEVDAIAPQMTIGNSAKVRLGAVNKLEVIKQFTGSVPAVVTDNRFEFYAYREDESGRSSLANQEYILYNLDADGNWVRADGIYGTDANGRFFLCAGQKAVFVGIPLTEQIIVEESENPFWEMTKDKTQTDTTITMTFTNEYRPVLYAQKKVENAPAGVKVQDETFVFRLLVNDRPWANAEYWIVDSARTDGGIPTKLGTGVTDNEGKFNIKAGQIIALFPGKVGVAYTLEEVGGAGDLDSWFCTTPSYSGTVPVLGVSRTITNYYKWKDLFLTKLITNQNAEDCIQAFTFRVTDENGNPVVGNRWVLLKDGQDTLTSDVLGSNGEFTCAMGGETVRIEGLEAGKKYTIEETESGTLYEAVEDKVTVIMPKYGASETAEITNDYLKRPLSVTKILLYDQRNPQQVQDAKDKEFIMTAWVDGKLLADTPYILSQGGTVIAGTYVTSSKGEFPLKNGQTATFKDIGMKGESFVVKETKDNQYGQIFPIVEGDDEGAFKGSLTGSENLATFVNGDGQDTLLMRKEYVGADAIGEAVVDKMKADPDLRAEAEVTLTLTVAPEGENSYIWPKSNTTVKVIDEFDGTVTDVIWQAGSSILLKPWQTVQISDIDKTYSYSLSEAKENQQRLIEWKNGEWAEIKQKTPENNRPVTGIVQEQPMAVITNQIIGLEPTGSEIKKVMREGALEVPEGAKLVWQLQEYNGDVWNPKEGIAYLTYDEEGPTCNGTLITGVDGKIILIKTEHGYPSVKFLEDEVKLNFTSEMKKGDLRMVEIIEESDPEWGFLAGYVDKDGNIGYDIAPEEAVGFVNSNKMTLLEIGKNTEQATDDTFIMIIEQVIEASAYPITSKEQILKTAVYGGMRYTIHDLETDELLGEGLTTASGEIIIKAGQYARLEVPDGTYWTIREKVVQPYELMDMTGHPPDKLTKLDDNLMLFQADVPKAEQGPWDDVTWEVGEEFTASDRDWVIIGKDDKGNALVATKYLIGDCVFNESNSDGNDYQGSILEAAMERFYHTDLTGVDGAAGSDDKKMTEIAQPSDYRNKTAESSGGLSAVDESGMKSTFALSREELNFYLPKSTDRGIFQDHEPGRGPATGLKPCNSYSWWLRTPDTSDARGYWAYIAYHNGTTGPYMVANDMGVRPALWVKIP